MVDNKDYLDTEGVQHLWNIILNTFVNKNDPLIILQQDVIPGTVQSITYDVNDLPNRVVHKRGSVNVRTDVITFSGNTITETRTTQNGETLTIVTDTETLVTNITYSGV